MSYTIEDYSDDGVRKAVITQTGADSCEIELSSGGFCQARIVTHEDLFSLKGKQLDKRPCMKFAEDYLKDGIEDLELSEINSRLRGSRRYMKCDVTLYFKNSCVIPNFDDHYGENIVITIDNIEYKATLYGFSYIKYKDLENMSAVDIFYSAGDHKLIEREDDYIRCFDTTLYSAKIDGILIYMHLDTLNIFKDGSYLKQIDYLNTHKLLKFPDKYNKNLTKAILLKKNKIILAYIHPDGTSEFIIE